MVRAMSKQDVEQDTWSLALDRTRETYELFDKVVVSFSGGKDSTVCLHAALEVAHAMRRLPVEVLFFDEEGIPYETEHYVRRVAERDDVNLTWMACPFTCRNACDPASGHSWWPWAPEDKDKWVRPLPPEAVTTHPLTDGVAPVDRITFAEFCFQSTDNTAFILGIRAEESLTRRRSVLGRSTYNWIINQPRNNVKVYPVYDMATADLWYLVKTLGWDHCEAYDLMEMAGVPALEQRVAPPFGEEPLRRLPMFAALFPDIWDRLQSRVPGADAAARYILTEAWAYSSNLQKPDGFTWPEYVRHLIEEHDEQSMRNQAIKQVTQVIGSHRKKTSDPILPDEDHPASGVSWRKIAIIAASGDTMNRKTASMVSKVNTGPKREKARERYERRLATLTPQDLIDLRP